MCAISVVQDYFGGRTGTPWTNETFGQYKEILLRLESLDKKLGEPECADPAKAAWMREVEERLAKLEEE